MAETEHCDLAIVAALAPELLQTVRKLRLKRQGERWSGLVAGKRVVAAVLGIGGQRAAAARRVIEEAQPGAMLLLGFSGGLDPSLKAGDSRVIRRVVTPTGGGYELFSVPEATAPAAMDGAGSSGADRAGDTDHGGAGTPADPQSTLLTVDTIISTIAAKRELWQRHRAGMVDMETYHIAAVAAELGVPLAVERAVTDGAGELLPPEVAGWVNERGRPDVFKVAWSILRKPSLIPALLRLSGSFRAAAASLGKESRRDLWVE